MRAITILAVAALFAADHAAAAGDTIPRLKDGTPDLQGVWTNSSLTFLQRPPVFRGLIATAKEEAAMLAGFRQFAGEWLLADHVDPTLGPPPVVKQAPQADILEMDLRLARVNGERRSSWIVEPADGQIPFTDAGRKAAADGSRSRGYDGPEARPNEERCLTAIGNPEGPPMMNTGFNANYQIVQTPGVVAILVEMNHDVRVIRMAPRGGPRPQHPPAEVRFWMDDSIGWWEGDTLVVETTNFRADAYVDSLSGGFAWSPRGRLTERFTRNGKDLIMYRFQVDDPAYFRQVWKAEMPMRATRGPIYEYACHEGNYSLPNILAGAREQERTAPAK